MHMESELKLRDCNRSIIKSARITVMLISGHKVVDDTTIAVNELRIERIRDGKYLEGGISERERTRNIQSLSRNPGTGAISWKPMDRFFWERESVTVAAWGILGIQARRKSKLSNSTPMCVCQPRRQCVRVAHQTRLIKQLELVLEYNFQVQLNVQELTSSKLLHSLAFNPLLAALPSSSTRWYCFPYFNRITSTRLSW